MPRKHNFGTFVVIGRYPFPVDMLRYDRCTPSTESDASEMRRAITEDRDERYSIQVMSSSEQVRRMGPTIARWESFGWKVVQDRC